MVALSYLEREQQDNFIWALEKVSRLFISNKLVSKVIESGGDFTLIDEIEVVFSTSINLLCHFYKTLEQQINIF